MKLTVFKSILVVNLILLPICVNAQVRHQTTKASTDAIVVSTLEHKYRWLKDWGWTKAVWPKTNDVYLNIRLKLDNELAAHKDTDALTLKYARYAGQHPHDPQSLYRWGYVTFALATQRGSGPESRKNKLQDVREAFPFARVPNSFEYSRLRFLVYAQNYGFQQLVPLGERLLRQQPNDFDVNYYLVVCLNNYDRDSPNQQKALLYTQKLIRQKPNVPSVYALLGAVYYRLWFYTREKKYADNAIIAYQKYLQIAPSSYQFRKNAQDNIEWIRQKSTE